MRVLVLRGYVRVIEVSNADLDKLLRRAIQEQLGIEVQLLLEKEVDIFGGLKVTVLAKSFTEMPAAPQSSAS